MARNQPCRSPDRGDVPSGTFLVNRGSKSCPEERCLTAPRQSRKGAAEPGAKEKYREEEKQDRQRQRQKEADRPDRGRPQGRKDKDFQRKF